MKEETAELTKKYIGDQTLEAFAESLGINTTRQVVSNWKAGKYAPDMMTLFRVLASPDSTPMAKTWAGEILSLYNAKTLADNAVSPNQPCGEISPIPSDIS